MTTHSCFAVAGKSDFDVWMGHFSCFPVSIRMVTRNISVTYQTFPNYVPPKSFAKIGPSTGRISEEARSIC